VVCNGPTAKVTALRDLLGVADTEGRPSIGRVVLFCNSQQSARFVDHELTEGGYKAVNYHGAIPANERSANFSRFVGEEAHVLVTTDLAARGLDELKVGHVVQFDFARSAADYVHRCGRTARAGRRGTVTSLVTKGDRELVRAIQKAQKEGQDLLLAGDALRRKEPVVPGKAQATFPESVGIPSSPTERTNRKNGARRHTVSASGRSGRASKGSRSSAGSGRGRTLRSIR
jgi:superfamily II DNA/RNA helicase